MGKRTRLQGLSSKRKATRRRAAFLLILFLVTGSIAGSDVANNKIAQANERFGWNVPQIQTPFVLGLDLQGGTRLEYEADLSAIPSEDRGDAMEGVRDVIERRVNTLGVSEPLVQTTRSGNEWRLSVELAGISDINEAINLIGETPILEFKEPNEEAPRDLTEEEQQQLADENEAKLNEADVALQEALKDPSSLTGDDLGFIRERFEIAHIFDEVKGLQAGEIHPTIVEDDAGYYVIRVNEVKDAGNEIKARHILISFAGATGSNQTRNRDEARTLIEELQGKVTAQNFEQIAKESSEEDGAAESGGDLGYFGKDVMVEQFEEAVYAIPVGAISDITETQFGFHLIYKEDERLLNDVDITSHTIVKTIETDIVPQVEPFKNTDLTGKHLKSSELSFDQYTSQAQVLLNFDSEGSDLFSEITRRNVGKAVAIYLDGEPISVPTVNQEITGGTAVITGSFNVEEAKLLAQRLNAGALPVPINLVYQQSVGPTLGAASVQASLTAALWGLLLVAIFMLLVYRLPGLLAIITLTLYVATSLAVFKLIPVTLTLSGIAGFILSIGIAVDANVLVFERLKEELKSEKELRPALEDAFRRAWTSIRDGNVTTLIACAVLYGFTSSVIKGFAVTLAIGILLSMLSAVVATRTILRFVSGWKWVRENKWLFP